MQNLYPAEIIVLTQIINRSRCEDEGFLNDSKKAAVDIMQYLTNEKLLVKVKEPVKEPSY